MAKETQWREEIALLNAILQKTSLSHSVKWGIDVYTYEGKNLVGIAGFKNHFALWFYNGVFLRDPYGMLINASEGKTRSLRQWRFNSAAEISERKILEYTREAITISRQGLSLEPDESAPPVPPEPLRSALAENPELKAAFRKLTPGRQKEYILYLEEAKRATTRESRLAKITPLILDGVGLNDKYR